MQDRVTFMSPMAISKRKLKFYTETSHDSTEEIRKSKKFQASQGKLSRIFHPKVSVSINVGSSAISHMRDSITSFQAEDFRRTRYKN